MKEHIIEYAKALRKIYKDEGLQILIKWFQTYYDEWYRECMAPGNRFIILEAIRKNQDNTYFSLAAKWAYCDICFEYNDDYHLQCLYDLDPLKGVQEYISYRIEHERLGGDKVIPWHQYIAPIRDEYAMKQKG